MTRLLVAAFYAFTPLATEQRESLLEDLPPLARDSDVVGSVLIAEEGVNGTISGPDTGVESLLKRLRQELTLSHGQFERLEVKRSWADKPVFRRFKARRKKEIVTMGVVGVNPRACVGTYVDPQDWNALVDDPDTVVIDTRNSYETAIGTFDGALDPGTESFREFPEGGTDPEAAVEEQEAGGSPCSAPAASAAKRPAVFCSRTDLGRCTTCAGAF